MEGPGGLGGGSSQALPRTSVAGTLQSSTSPSAGKTCAWRGRAGPSQQGAGGPTAHMLAAGHLPWVYIALLPSHWVQATGGPHNKGSLERLASRAPQKKQRKKRAHTHLRNTTHVRQADPGKANGHAVLGRRRQGSWRRKGRFALRWGWAQVTVSLTV